MRNLALLLAAGLVTACRTGGSGVGSASGLCVPGDSGPAPPVIVTRSDVGRAGTLRVTVRDWRTDAPIADAAVAFQPSRRWTTTDDRGEARLDSVPAGSRVLTVRRVGYQTRVDTLSIASDTGEHVIARLQRQGLCAEKVVQVGVARPAT